MTATQEKLFRALVPLQECLSESKVEQELHFIFGDFEAKRLMDTITHCHTLIACAYDQIAHTQKDGHDEKICGKPGHNICQGPEPVL